MKMSIKVLLPLVLLLTLPAVVQAQFTFTTNNGAITITGYTGPGGAVTIPSATNGYLITGIGVSAFYGCSSLTSIMTPNSVTNIGSYAFSYCNGLVSATISNGFIPYEAFCGCTSLTNVTIGSNVTGIAQFAFDLCSSLTRITVDPLSATLSSMDGVVFDKGRTTLIQYPMGKAGNYTVPDSTTAIVGDAFFGCGGLTGVTITSNVTSIGNSAFYNCGNLTNVTIGNGVTNISDFAFYRCGLTSVTVPDTVISIGNYAFEYCGNLANITLGKGLSLIGRWAFNYCGSLITITVDLLNMNYSTVDGVLFNKSQTTLIQYPIGRSGGCSIPSSVTTIGSGAFAAAVGLTDMTIPDNVTNVMDNAFSSSGLTSITIGKNVATIGDRAFSAPHLSSLYFRGAPPILVSSPFFYDRATVYYLPGTGSWGSTFGGLPTGLWWLPGPVILNIGPNFGVQNKQFGFMISWATNAQISIEACTNVGNNSWAPISTNTLSNGTNYFSDATWTNYSCRFYRIRSP